MTSTPSARAGSLDVPGGRLAYDLTGSGPALVLVHAGIADRRMWDDVVPALATGHSVVRYDTRGFGETTMTEAVAYSNRRDLVDLLDDLGIERAAVCGASRGGSIALDTALEFPDRVAALVLVGSGVSGYDGGATPEEDAAFEELDRLEEAGEWDALVEAEMALWVDGVDGGPDRIPDVRRRVAAMDRAAYAEHADEPLDGVTPLQPPAAGRLDEVRAPTLVLVGDLDTSGTRAAAETLADGIRDVRLEVLPGVAHLPSMEAPEQFVALVRAFLAEVGA